MALNKGQLTAQLTAFFSDISPTATPTTKAITLANIIDGYIKSAGVKVGSLSSNGTGNLGAPVSSQNTSTGELE